MERKLLLSDLNLGYEGFFEVADFFRLIDDWFKNNGYNKNEIKHTEKVSEKGKYVEYEIMPYKEINDYTRFEVYVRIKIRDLVDANIKKDGMQMKINKGKISITIDCFLATDIRNRWESKPVQFFLRTIFDKFINREYTATFEKKMLEDVKNFHSELKAYLNLGRYSQQA